MIARPSSARRRDARRCASSNDIDDMRPELYSVAVFAGYSSILTEPEGLRFGSLRRTNDGFFLKVSYLFRL